MLPIWFNGKMRRFTRRNVKYYIPRGNLISGLRQMSDSKNSITMRSIWGIIFVTCLTLCSYQSFCRFIHYMSEPAVVNVYYREISHGYLPMLHLKFTDNSRFRKYESLLLKHFNVTRAGNCVFLFDYYIQFGNITVDEYWTYFNTTNAIKDVHLMKDKRKYFNVTLISQKSITGTDTDVYYNDIVRFGDPAIRLKIKLDYPLEEISKCRIPPVIITVVQKISGNISDAKGFEILSPSVKTELAITAEKYVFVNTTRAPCTSIETYNTCRLKCIYSSLAEINSPCRFAGLLEFTNTNSPYCKTSPETGRYLRLTAAKYQSVDADTDCNCIRPCEKEVFNKAPVYDESGKKEIEIFIQNNIVRTLVEELVYSFISLLCDVGGNIGLFLGMSCLAGFDMITFCEQKLSAMYNKRYYPKARIYKRVLAIVEKEVTRTFTSGDDKFRYVMYGGRMKKTVIGLATFAFLYQSYDRIAYYLSYPVFLKVNIVKDDFVTFPEIVICNLPDDIREELDVQFGKSCDDKGMLDLLNATKYKNIRELWNATSNYQQFSIDEMFEFDGALTLGNLSSFETVFGICTKLSLSNRRFKMYGNNLVAVTPYLNPICGCQFMDFIIPFEEVINLRRYVHHACDGRWQIVLSLQSFIRKNTPRNLCMTSEAANECQQKCYVDEFFKKNITCRLPFMNSFTISDCNTSDAGDAKHTRKAYLEAFMNTDAYKQCNCHQRCNETLYIPLIVYDPTIPFIMDMFVIQTNLREVIEQELSFPIIKLLCDVGSFLGVLLGFSIISLFELIQFVMETVGLKK